MNSAIARPSYDDIFIRILLSLFAAHFIVVYGDSEDIGTIIKHFDYYNALISSFVIAFLILYYIWLITRFLDRHFDWFLKTAKRVATQFLLGFIAPAGISVALAWVYFSMYGYAIGETPYFDSDFPVILLLIAMANVYYFIYYLVTMLWPQRNHIPEQQSPGPQLVSPTIREYRKVILVNSPLKTVPVPVEDCCYFFREEKRNYLRTADGGIQAIDQSLDELESTLDPKDFFRINRQMIVSFNACREIVPTDGPRLELRLAPAYNKAILVSETRVTAFKNWMDR